MEASNHGAMTAEDSVLSSWSMDTYSQAYDCLHQREGGGQKFCRSPRNGTTCVRHGGAAALGCSRDVGAASVNTPGKSRPLNYRRNSAARWRNLVV